MEPEYVLVESKTVEDVIEDSPESLLEEEKPVEDKQWLWACKSNEGIFVYAYFRQIFQGPYRWNMDIACAVSKFLKQDEDSKQTAEEETDAADIDIPFMYKLGHLEWRMYSEVTTRLIRNAEREMCIRDGVSECILKNKVSAFVYTLFTLRSSGGYFASSSVV